MERIVAFSHATGGYFCEDDFRNYHPEWVEPITQDYRGYTVCEIPPNGHGITVLMALGILNGMTMPENRESAEHYHKVMEAIKLAFADTRTYVADPRYMKTKVSELLDPAYLAARRALNRSLKLLFDEKGDLVSFVDGMVTDERDLTDAMYAQAAMHDEKGAWQMIFGVNTLPSCRRHGYAGKLLEAAIADARQQGRQGLVLTCKDKLLPYYAKFGFQNEGISASIHGGVTWYQMRLSFE